MFGGVHIIADSHFEYGNKFLDKVKIWTNNTKTVTLVGKENKTLEKSTNEEETYLKKHQRLRARVENAFGIMTTMFTSLRVPWSEDERQLDYLVFIAAAIVNIKLS